jgi:hypothetical protein
MDACSLCWCAAFQEFDSKDLCWLCHYLIWSLEEGVPWCHRSTSRCLWPKFLQLGWSKVSPFCACLFSFWYKMVTLCPITLPQSAPEMRVCQYMWDPLGAQLVTFENSYDYMHSASVHVQFHLQGANGSIYVLAQSILDSCSALWISDNVRLSYSWHACSKHAEPVYCRWYTCSTIDCAQPRTNLSRLTSSCSKKIITALLSYFDAFTVWSIIGKLCCNVVCTGYSPFQLYCSTQVSAS